MRNKKKEQEINVTECVLRLFDGGMTSPSAILLELMRSVPLITTASIKYIISVNRGSGERGGVTAKADRPKTEIEILADSIAEKCRNCEFHQGERPCVLPWSLCSYPSMDTQVITLKNMLLAQKKKDDEARSKAKQIITVVRKNKKNIGTNEFDLFEAEINSMFADDNVDYDNVDEVLEDVKDDAFYNENEGYFDDEDGIEIFSSILKRFHASTKTKEKQWININC